MDTPAAPFLKAQRRPELLRRDSSVMKTIVEVVPKSAAPYPVLCGPVPAAALSQVWQPGWRQAVLIGDDTTDGLFGNSTEEALKALGCEVLRLKFAPGEANKTRSTKERLENAMLAAGIDRSACVVALGGGIPLDVAGFVAATYMRGIAHVNIATTLLAQVDAAVGGKTGVNTDKGKNLVGAFHQPKAVLLDTAALASLSDVELRNGLAEAIKHAVLRDAELFADIEQWAAALPEGSLAPLPDPLIARCVEIKAEVVAEDDRDQGMRHILNFGHTVAHAVEHATAHATPHGHAVAIGMVVETQLANKVPDLAFPRREIIRLVALLERLGLPTSPPCSFEAASSRFVHDKKTEAAIVRCALPCAIGQITADETGHWARAVSLEQLAAAG